MHIHYNNQHTYGVFETVIYYILFLILLHVPRETVARIFNVVQFVRTKCKSDFHVHISKNMIIF